MVLRQELDGGCGLLLLKDISSFITSTTINLPFNQTGLPQSLLPSNFTGNEIFSVRSSFNTEGGKVKGLELNYQQPFTFLPSFGKNIGLLANYTFIKSKIKYATSATNNTPDPGRPDQHVARAPGMPRCTTTTAP